jgi:hypothetical protein
MDDATGDENNQNNRNNEAMKTAPNGWALHNA